MQRFRIKTFGCKTNQYEEEGIRELLLAAGWQEAARLCEAQVLILNTCTVTAQAGARCRRFAAQALRENPSLRLILTGCAADAEDEWLQEFSIEAVFPNSRKAELVCWLQNAAGASACAGDNPEPDGFAFSLQRFSGHTRAFLKIQDGCANFCSYCIIPHVRGTPRSRPADEILQEARQLTGNGYTELVLTGINIGEYRKDGLGLAELAGLIARTPGLQRLRLGSVEPQSLTPELLATLRESPVICPHLHLPLQSGDDEILRAMNRHYTTGEFLQALAAARAALDRPAITTDIIVGFPGETDEHFARTCELVRKAAFARGHLFVFSPRPGTPAAEAHLRHPVPRAIADERHRELTAICAESAAAYAATLTGMRESVMPERKTPEGWVGYCERYLRTTILPDGAPPPVRARCLPVRITGNAGETLLASADSQHANR